MICPLCGATNDPLASIAGLTICPTCFRTLTASDPPLVATTEQTFALRPEEVAALRRLRTQARRG